MCVQSEIKEGEIFGSCLIQGQILIYKLGTAIGVSPRGRMEKKKISTEISLRKTGKKEGVRSEKNKKKV